MTQWGASDTGILRKNKPKDNHEDLLVFGYACKLFRDNEKALFVDQGKHLISWMGDETLKIDRYDCRGALSDLAPFQASREGFDAMRWLGLNESERKLEQLCDKERYYCLHINEEEEQMYKEEEQKRKKTNEFQYTYDVPQEPQENTVKEEEKDEEFVPLPNLDLPIDITIPKTVKENKRIEKTALFVCKQGLQMEILIKAKQANNPQFAFLNQGHELNKYYRHILSAMKAGHYNMTAADQSEKTEESGDHYLHPSLVSNNNKSEQASTCTISTVIPLKSTIPSTDCTYSQLVNRIQGTQLPEQTKLDFSQLTYEQQQYYQYYYTTQYYEYYKKTVQTTNDGQSQPPETDPKFQNYVQQMTYPQYLQQQQDKQNNPYAQIVSNVCSLTALPDSNVNKETKPESTEEFRKPLLSLAQYGTSDEDEEEEDKIPDGETKVVIDKMASYVAKNGQQFEEIVKAKGDPRFEFLKESHEFYKYYRSKLKEFNEPTITDNKTVPKHKEKKTKMPVCFSIKKFKDDPPKEIKSALPVEESDEEINEEEECKTEKQEENEISHDNSKLDDDPIFEMIDLTDDCEERKDAKRAEDKIKDKLAAAAREKLASVARDRALQLERKKKAEAFLKLKAETEGDKLLIDVKTSKEETRKRKKSSKSHKKRHSRHVESRKKSKKKRTKSNSSSSSNS